MTNTRKPVFVPVEVDMSKINCRPENARKYKEWLASRGGLAVWDSKDFGNLGQSWVTPVNDQAGNPYGPPHWKCGGPGSKPDRIVTNPADVVVVIDREVERFPIKLKQDGMMIVLTKQSRDKVNKAKERIGKGSYHVFEDGSLANGLLFGSDTCIIMAPEKVVPLMEFDHEAWEKEHGVVE